MTDKNKDDLNAFRRDLLKGTLAAGLMMGSVTDNYVQAQDRAGVSPISFPSASTHSGFRLVTFEPNPNEKPRIGVVLNDGQVIDLAVEAHGQKINFDPYSMLSLIHISDLGLAQVQRLVSHAMKKRMMRPLMNQVRLLSPIPRPQSNIYAVGWNYLDHFEEGQENRLKTGVKHDYPKHPVFFTKGVYTMNGPFDEIPFDTSNSTMADWEAELAVIIGKTGTNIAEKNAMDYVYGYAVYNDTTLRDVQHERHSEQWFKGKSINGFGPMGPWILTANAVDLDSLRIICRVNGVEKQNASYSQMYFKIPQIIAELSRGLTLEAGDIIATGTPSGVGYARKPPEFLKVGDIMETEIKGIGLIRNPIRDATIDPAGLA
jgi:2-keto-4-pentenoate hydratase/2-oxohepta-3-ene-1,7-dioic acid hydratase in catechol pathway